MDIIKKTSVKFMNNYYRNTSILIFIFFFFFLYNLMKNKKINFKLNEESKKLEKSLSQNYNNFLALPNKSFTESELNRKLTVFVDNINNKNISGIIYSNNDTDKLVNNFYKKYSKTNPLHADLYPQIRMMEVDIVNMCKDIYKCDKNCSGSITSGGTESILLSCLTYRDYCLENDNIENPNIIGFTTIHPAFDKACHYFNIKMIKVDNIEQMRKKINKNTIG